MILEPPFSSDRLFQVWRYTVSHSQLLIQSHKTDGAPTRLELLFKNVDYMAIPPIMSGLSITSCPRSKLPEFLAGLEVAEPWYELGCEKGPGYIACGAVVFSEDELGYEQPSALLDDFGL